MTGLGMPVSVKEVLIERRLDQIVVQSDLFNKAYDSYDSYDVTGSLKSS